MHLFLYCTPTILRMIQISKCCSSSKVSQSTKSTLSTDWSVGVPLTIYSIISILTKLPTYILALYWLPRAIP